MATAIKPKVFISYSWTSEAHKERVKDWADRLLESNIETIIDVYDVKPGHDLIYFMEQMVHDEFTHVLVMCDHKYAEKANKRRAGVGTEAQIIVKKVYNKVSQTKFIPIVCEFTTEGDACVPILGLLNSEISTIFVKSLVPIT